MRYELLLNQIYIFCKHDRHLCGVRVFSIDYLFVHPPGEAFLFHVYMLLRNEYIGIANYKCLDINEAEELRKFILLRLGDVYT